MLKGKIVKTDPLSTTKYYLCDGTGIKVVQTNQRLDEGDCVEVEGKEENGAIMVENISKIKQFSVEKFFQIRLHQPAKPLVDTAVMKHLERHFNDAAHLIAKAVLELRQIKLRYDGDGDGIMAGLVMKKAIEHYAEEKNVPLSLICQQSQRTYLHRDLQDDNSALLEGATIIFLDFGSSPDSREHVCTASQRFEVIVVDHHPPDKKLCAAAFVSPFQTELNEPSSNYNAGLLAFEIGRRLAPKIENQLKDYAIYSMESDHSAYAGRNIEKDGEGDAARAISYLSVAGQQPRQLDFYESILADESKVKELAREEREKIQRALQKALKKAKTTLVGEMLFVQADLANAVAKNEYPSRGRLTNAVQDYFAATSKEPVISINWDLDSLSFRATASAVKKGFSANKVITALKKEFGTTITGGGHDIAAGLRFPKELMKSVVQRTIEIVKEQNG